MIMAKKKSRSNYEFTVYDSEILGSSDILNFAVEPPEVFDEALKKLKDMLEYYPPEPGMTPLEFNLRRLEKDAREILTAHGYPTDLNELQWLIEKHTYPVETKLGGSAIHCDVDIKSQSARRVLLSAMRLRDDIANNDAESAANEMMRIMYAAFNMSGFELIMRGVRAKKGSHLGGRAPKIKKGIASAIYKIFKENGLKLKNIDVWNYFKDNYNFDNQQTPMVIGDYEVYFQILDGEERIVEAHLHEDPNREKIFTVSKSTFLKKWVPRVRQLKELRNQFNTVNAARLTK
jgi:hypothetical protein